MSDAIEEPTPVKGRPGWLRPLIIVAILVAVGFGVANYVRGLSYETTDNAATAADVVQVVPQVTGNVAKLHVDDNQEVKAGDLLIELDPSKYEAAVNIAEANLKSAVADAQAAGIDVRLTSVLGEAERTTASGTVGEASGSVGVAEAGVGQARANVGEARATEQVASQDERSAQIDVENAKWGEQGATGGVASASAALEAAKSQEGAAQASVDAARVKLETAAKQATRMETLYKAGAVSQRDLDLARWEQSDAQSGLDTAEKARAAAESAIKQRQAELDEAKVKVSQSQAMIRQARSRFDSAVQRHRAMSAATASAQAGLQSAEKGLAAAEGRARQSLGLSQSANASGEKVRLKEAAQLQAQAKVDQARAVLTAAKLDLQHTRLYSPITGRVSRKLVQLGGLAQAGAPLLSVVPEERVYVVANYKETQTAKIKVGQEAEIEVDGLPGKRLPGHVESISAATGSTFALLPPDNATGNFVKVVQRVPVRIKLDRPEDAALLRVGLSSVVSIKVR
ncbi:MAG: HlyD family efflux transporter periplasmic adaptor subunit [Armatimonadetes bacterium]|nr:HlyD family efflux transporter periplasmic adaptor subunit [Armatimonadota bacterium]